MNTFINQGVTESRDALTGTLTWRHHIRQWRNQSQKNQTLGHAGVVLADEWRNDMNDGMNRAIRNHFGRLLLTEDESMVCLESVLQRSGKLSGAALQREPLGKEGGN